MYFNLPCVNFIRCLRAFRRVLTSADPVSQASVCGETNGGVAKCWMYSQAKYYIEDITRWREDMNFIFRVAKQYFTHSLRSFVKYCFCHEKIKFISSSRRVMSFLLYRLKDVDKIIQGNYQNYVIDKLTCEIMENKPLGSRM